MSDTPEQEPEAPKRPSKLVLTATLAPLIALTIVANIGARTWFTILPDNPALALAMNPTNVVMAAASPQLDAPTYYAIVIIRRLLVDPCYWLLGVWYGHRAFNWLKRKSRDLGPLAEKLEEWFPRYGSLLILLNQHALLFLLAGSSGMRLRKVMLLDFIGTVVTAVVIRRLGDRFSTQVGGFTGFLKDNQKIFAVISALLLVYFVADMYRNRHDKGVDATRRDLEDD